MHKLNPIVNIIIILIKRFNLSSFECQKNSIPERKPIGLPLYNSASPSKAATKSS